VSSVSEPSDGCPKCTDTVRRCDKMLRLLPETITFDEFAYNVTLTLVTTCSSCMQAWVDSLPAQTASDLLAYFQLFLIPVDYLPDPRPFIAAPATEEEIQQKKQLLKPQYNQLYQMVRSKVSKGSQTSK